jgi:hypothetical protein
MQTKYALAVILPAIVLMMITPTAFANNGIGAIVTKQDAPSCALIDPADVANGNNVANFPGSLHDVTTPSGNENIVCKATLPGYNGPAVSFNNANTGLSCYGLFGQTSTDWNEQVSASGKVTFTCGLTGVTLP